MAPADVVPILDRYLMFYIRTADKLQRTARWLEALPGGIAYLRQVILEDKLGICSALEAQMQTLVDSFFDEWAEAIRDPAIAAKFRQFANTDEGAEGVETEADRGQRRPVYWPRDAAADDFAGLASRWSSTAWQPVLEASRFDGADDAPNGISATIKRGDTQLAVWRICGRYYAAQQMCPHKRAFVLSDGLVGEDPPSSSCTTSSPSSSSSAPWISCPHHKRNYDLAAGNCKNDPALSIATFETEARADGLVYVRLPPVDELDAALGTSRWMVRKADAPVPEPFAELDRKIGFVGRRRGRKPGAKPPKDDLPVRPPSVEAVAVGGGCGMAPEW